MTNDSPPRLVYCHCAYAQIVPPDVKQQVLRAIVLVGVDQRERAAVFLVAGPAHGGERGAEQRVVPVAGFFGGGADARAGGGLHPRIIAQGLRDRGDGKAEPAREAADGRSFWHEKSNGSKPIQSRRATEFST